MTIFSRSPAFAALALVTCASCVTRTSEPPLPNAEPPVWADMIPLSENRETLAAGAARGASGASAAPAKPPALLAQAREVFSRTKETTYTHKLEIDEARGRFALDCSGFVEYTLAKGAPAALADLEAGLARMQKKPPKRPLAKHFVRYFSALGDGGEKSANWKPVSRVSEMRAGDVLAWLMPEEIESTNTGHVMIVRATPSPNGSVPGEWIVPVADATSRKHGKSDSRAKSGTTGLGIGDIVLLADAQGIPKGYRWSMESKNERSTTVAMARPID